jgi:hypothetical protein
VAVVILIVFWDWGTGEFIADMVATMPRARKERQNSFFIVDLPAFLREFIGVTLGR